MLRIGPLLLGILVACATTGESESDAPTSSDDSPPSDGETQTAGTDGDTHGQTEAWPLSVQLHLHGPLSEGDGTHSVQDEQARLWGVDTVWWTDHAAMYELGQITEPNWDMLSDADNLPVQDEQKGIETAADQWWSFWRQSGATFTYGLEDEAAPDGGRALTLTVEDGKAGSVRWADATWKAVRAYLYRPLLAKPVVSMQLYLPADYDPALHAVRVVVKLSRLDVSHRVRLLVHDEADTVTVADSLDVELPDDRSVVAYGSELVPMTFTAGAWNELELDLAELLTDHAQGLDLASQDVVVQLATRDTTPLTVQLAGISLSHDGDADALVTRQAELLDAMSDAQLTHLVGQELSFEKATASHHHLTAFTPEVASLISLEDLTDTGDPRTPAAAQVTADGGVTALAHPFSVSLSINDDLDAEAEVADLCATLVADEGYGVQLIEAGYRERGLDLESHLALWDCLGVGGLRLHGIGTSDLHNPADWSGWDNNYVTWVHDAMPDRTSIIAGLQSGRLFFGDPTVYDNVRLDLTQEGASVLGQTLSLPAVLTPELRGVQGRETARWVVDGEVVWTGRVSELAPLELAEGRVARLELRDGAGGGLLFSNAVWFD